MPIVFSSPNLLDHLEKADAATLDALPFGLIAMDADGHVLAYNAAEAALSGLTPSRVIGRHFFSAVAPCANNYMVAQRFESEPELDEFIDYVFTLRMATTPVRLRLLKSGNAHRMYLAVERRT